MHRPASSTPAGLRRAIGESVEAAQATDAERFGEAAARLATQDPQRLVLVQAGVIRSLLEELHPDGLSAADAQDVLRRCLTSAASWYPPADPGVLVLVLTGALGLAEAEPAGSGRDSEAGPGHAAGPADLGAGAALLIADLLGAAGAPLAGYLDAALAELERAETIEMP